MTLTINGSPVSADDGQVITACDRTIAITALGACYADVADDIEFIIETPALTIRGVQAKARLLRQLADENDRLTHSTLTDLRGLLTA